MNLVVFLLRKELEQRAVAQPLLGSGAAESESQLPAGPVLGLEEGEQAPTLAELERRYIVHTLEETAGRVSGAKGAAAMPGVKVVAEMAVVWRRRWRTCGGQGGGGEGGG